MEDIVWVINQLSVGTGFAGSDCLRYGNDSVKLYEVLSMKIMTLNTHSLIEEQYLQKLELFVNRVAQEKPDVIAMQEVNQPAGGPLENLERFPGLVLCKENEIPLRKGNHAAQVAARLQEKGIPYYWTWLPIKLGYGKYDEGMAIFSRYPIMETDVCCISSFEDYRNWRTRKILGVQIKNSKRSWFYTVHMGGWNDKEEPFLAQWNRLEEHLRFRKKTNPVWLLGDFNSPAEVRGEGYDCIRKSGWKDTYLLAKEKDSGIPVKGVIDGWREQLEAELTALEGMRIDQIWCSQEEPVLSSRVVFNGSNGAVVSDHYGVMIQTEGDKTK